MADNGSASTSIDIEDLCKELVIEVPDSMQTTLRKEICIFHVPVTFRGLNEVSYTPQVISIGPIHHKEENEGMKTQKRRYFKDFFDRLPDEKGKTRELFRKELVSTIKDREVQIRNCYQDEASKLCEDPKVFLKMILWDVVFILELFLKTGEYDISEDKYKNDYIIGKPWLTAAIQRDLILLENQLPFWILDEIYNLAIQYIKTDCSSFLELTCQYFDNYNKNKTNPQKTLHFTDLVRFFLSSEHPKPNFSSTIRNLYRATRLHQAGIKFKPRSNKCLLDIRAWSAEPKKEGNPIKKGELHVPPLEIDDNTECLLRNLMVLEQCYYPYEAYICQYVKFLDFLVDINEDADLLIKSKVIINRLGKSAAVAELISELSLEIVEVSSCYSDLATQLNDYYKSSINHSHAYLRRVYFRNVWIGTGTVVGLIVLVITLVNFGQSFS